MHHGFAVVVVGHLFRVGHSFLEVPDPVPFLLVVHHRVVFGHDEVAPTPLGANVRHGLVYLCVFGARRTAVELLAVVTLETENLMLVLALVGEVVDVAARCEADARGMLSLEPFVVGPLFGLRVVMVYGALFVLFVVDLATFGDWSGNSIGTILKVDGKRVG